MIDITRVSWKPDRITTSYIARNVESLITPEKMAARALADAITYCNTIYNPYAFELMKRSGHFEKFQNAWTNEQRREIFDKSCLYHGLKIC